MINRTVLPILILCIIASTSYGKRPDPPQRSARGNGTIRVLPQQLIIKVRAGVPLQPGTNGIGVASLQTVFERIHLLAAARLSTSAALQRRGPSRHIDRMIHISYAGTEDPILLAREISTDPSVEYAEPCYEFPMDYTPSDAQLANQWAITVMKLKEAWDITKGDSTIVIGDVDTGVDWTHEDLRDKIWINPGEWGTSGELSNNGRDDDGNGKVDDWHGWDFVGDGSAQSPIPDNNPMDGTIGHGTNTSSCFGANTDNGIGIAGSGFRVKILPVKVSGNASGNASYGYQGIVYAMDMGCRIINCSWGGTGAFSQALQDIIDDANAQGVLLVSSSGNDPIDNDYVPHYPSSLNHVLCVGSVESNGSASNWCTYGTSVSTYSPGNGILMVKNGGGDNTAMGTSFSSPLAAGVAGLVFSLHPDWTPDQVAAQIRVTSVPFTTPVSSKRYGRIDAFRAVSLNQTLTDIPGLRLKQYSTVVAGGGSTFSQPGQTAQITVTIENVLAPTTATAEISIAPDDASLTSNDPPQSIGVMQTFGTKSFTFNLALAQTPTISEGNLPVRFRVDDGTYTDFFIVRVPIYLDDAWHTAVSVGVPTFLDLDVLDASAVWAIGTFQGQDLCLRTVNGGAQWSNVTGGGYPTGQGIYCIAGVNTQMALVGTGPTTSLAQVVRTTNGGSSWTGTSVSSVTGFVNWIHMYDAQNGILQGDPKGNIWGIARTTDGGASWAPLQTTVPSAASEAGWAGSYAAIGDTLWFGTNNSRIYRSIDRGQTWSSFSTPSKHSVEMSFADAFRGIIHFNQQTNQGGTDMLAITSDGGETWTEVKSISPAGTAIALMEPNGIRSWYLTAANAYVSTNFGQSWTVQARPADYTSISAGDIWANQNWTDVYAAGYDVFKYRSQFRPIETQGANATALPASLGIDEVFPHPLSSGSASGVIQFHVPVAPWTSLALYDNLGRLVRTVVSARLDAGAHSARLDTQGLAAGMYLLRLDIGEYRAHLPVIISR
jgi:subtilisin family serine protease